MLEIKIPFKKKKNKKQKLQPAEENRIKYKLWLSSDAIHLRVLKKLVTFPISYFAVQPVD